MILSSIINQAINQLLTKAIKYFQRRMEELKPISISNLLSLQSSDNAPFWKIQIN